MHAQTHHCPPTITKWVTLNDSTTTYINETIIHSQPTQIQWTPEFYTPFHKTPHPLKNLINDVTLQLVKQSCQYCPDNEVLRSIGDTTVIINTDNMRDLISSNNPINDQIITLYLEMISNKYGVACMATSFFPWLVQQGWENVLHLFTSHTKRRRRRLLNRPFTSGEPCILIPAFVNECHWIAIARREINDRVYFFYNDDTNNPNTEADIRTILQYKTDQDFYPPTATWINCRSTYYIPHSNECGPRTLLALHMMAIHPNPNIDMLTPIMHANLAQISRTWITSSLLSGHLIDEPIIKYAQATSAAPTFSTTSLNIPSSIIQWTSAMNSNTYSLSLSQPSTDDDQYHFYANNDNSNMQNLWLDKNQINQDPTENSPKNKSKSSHNPTKITVATPSHSSTNAITTSSQSKFKPTNHPIPHHSTPETDIKNKPIAQKNMTQSTLDLWTEKRTHLKHNNILSRTDTDAPIIPYGTPFPSIDPTTTMHIIMQNTQYSLQLSNDEATAIQTILNLKTLGASIYTAISPNINWCNSSNTVSFKRKFTKEFKQIHINATSSNIGKHPNYFHQQNLTGGVAIISIDLWASKVVTTECDPRGHGSYVITTFRGRNGKFLSLIGAYISVNKGQNPGPNTVWAQQMTIMEQEAMKRNKILPTSTCPRKEAIKALGNAIEDLQKRNHAIILMIDANQTPKESKTKATIKQHSIEWLRVEYGLTDPFIELVRGRPNTTTTTAGRDIDYVLTYSVDIKHITTLGIHLPTMSDHLGIGIDIDISTFFNGTYSTLESPPGRILTQNNVMAKRSYIKHIVKEANIHQLWYKANHIYRSALSNTFTSKHERLMNAVDEKLGNIIINGEKQSGKSKINKNAWPPTLCCVGRTVVYWKRKHKMSKQKLFKWHDLSTLCDHTQISDESHTNTDTTFIKQSLCEARKEWKNIKKQSDRLRKEFLENQAKEHASKMNTSKEKALKAILQTEDSKQQYKNIREITGHRKERNPLTQIEIDDPTDSTNKLTLTTKVELEDAIIMRNQRHSRQALQTPLATNPTFAATMDPLNEDNKIEDILNGSFSPTNETTDSLSPIELEWIKELRTKIMAPIDTYVSIKDFKRFFKHRKERTASSPSG
jgi:hypothetical protein